MHHRVLSAAGLALIREYEGFHAAPTPAGDGRWIVGHGHVRQGAPGGSVSEEEAGDLLGRDVAVFERLVNAALTEAVSQSQFDALVSFAFSIGAEAFGKCDVLRRTNGDDARAAACALDAWRQCEVEGELEISAALLRRRAAEKAHYLKDVVAAPAPSALVAARIDHAVAILGAPSRPAPKRAAAAKAKRGARVMKPAPAQVLTQILMAEPATAAVLAARATPAVALSLEDAEITSAHAKPVAREAEEERFAMWRAADTPKPMRFDFGAPHEAIGLAALSLFGVALIAIGGWTLFGAPVDAVGLMAATALVIPGLAAITISALGLIRAPAHR